MSFDTPVSISVVVPVYSGEAFLADLIAQLEQVRTGWRERGAPMELSEVILVDDSAIDGSPAVIDRLAAEHGWVTAIHLMRNFGQHAATIAGVLHSSGDWVVTLDEDLQHPPSEIETLLRQAVGAGSDIVYAKPASAVHEARWRDWASRGFKKMMVFLTGNPNISHFNSFRLLRGSMARAASSVCGYDTYFDVALSWFTKRIGVLTLELKDQRFISSGSSGYSFRRLLSHARRLLISSQVKVIRMFGLVGMSVVGIAMLGAIALLLQKIISPDTINVTGWTSLMLAILFLGGVIAFMVALALEYLSTLVQASHGKPLFFTVDRSIDARLADYFRSQPT
ncbi:glycosyl transferase [Azorhizobium oxalatiphilum]|uniref:Glycosyl transferase n=1 Tax=Azorhizobium oxalatiphilum TaxID=980631 RepID=A0A917FFI6_9HYPH|nr:glycosyltransferase [Azorhizobium oxalatiphilum]GGF72979.1 glycosyl transferase [Azorhizobium oxalatiphilum]